MLKYKFWISVLMVVLVIVLVITGRGQEGIASTITGAILVYWLGQGENEKPVKKSNNSRGA